MRDLRQASAEQSKAESWKHLENGLKVSEEISAHVREKETEIRMLRIENRSK